MMSNSETRWGVAAALTSFLLLGGCSFLIDTNKLQKGGSAGAAGQAGSGGALDAGDDVSDAGGADVSQPDADAAPGCTDDLACLDDDPCTVDTCNLTSGKCEHSPFQGIGLVNESMVGSGQDYTAIVQPGVDQIGLPVLTADGESFWLGYWYEVGSGTSGASRDVVIKHYQATPSAAPVEASLKSGSFSLDDLFTSPALVVRQFKSLGDAGVTAKRLAVVVGGDVTGAGAGVYVRMLDPDSLQPAGSTVVPPMLQGGMSPSDFADPVNSAPAALVMDDHLVFTWVYGAKLYTWDAHLGGVVNQTAEKHDVPNDVLNAVPIQGTNIGFKADFGAVLEIAKTGGIYSTDLWTHGNDQTLKNLEPNSGARLGVAAGAFLDPPDDLSIVAWSYESATGPVIKSGGAVCGGTDCNAAAFPGNSSSNEGAGMYPAISSTWLSAYSTVRGVAISQVLHKRDGADAGAAYSAVIATAMALDPNADAGSTQSYVNPPVLLVRGPVASASDKPKDSPYGHTAIAVTASGSIMVAWVEKDNGKMSLRARRYGTKQCN